MNDNNESNNKEVIELENGKIVVIKNTSITFTSLFCDLCGYPLKSLDDSIAFRKSGVCAFCELHWGFDKRYDLKNGKYPPKDTEVWNNYIETKKLASRIVINLK